MSNIFSFYDVMMYACLLYSSVPVLYGIQPTVYKLTGVTLVLPIIHTRIYS